MDRLPILCGGERVGEADAEQERLSTCLRVRVASRRGIWRAWAVGERGEIRIGTLEPVGGESVIARRFSRQSLSKVGTLSRVEIRPASDEPPANRATADAIPANSARQSDGIPAGTTTATGIPADTTGATGTPADTTAQPDEPTAADTIPATPEAWTRAGDGPLFRTRRFRRQSRHVRDALTSTDGDRRRVALARDENAPFPLPELFCLASPARIGARDYWVFAFDRQEWPVF